MSNIPEGFSIEINKVYCNGFRFGIEGGIYGRVGMECYKKIGDETPWEEVKAQTEVVIQIKTPALFEEMLRHFWHLGFRNDNSRIRYQALLEKKECSGTNDFWTGVTDFM